MSSELTNLIENWDGQGVVARFDAPTGAWMLLFVLIFLIVS